MSDNDLKAKANANIHCVAGTTLTQRESDPAYGEYRQRWDEQPASMQPGAFPLFLDLEVTNLCNLQCEFCATTYFGPEVKRGFIDLNLVKKIINEGAANGLYGVKFNDRGEPLMHPDLAEMVRYAKSAGLIDVYFNTNALLLDEQKTKEILEAGLDRISISFEGHTSEVYEKYRIKSSYDKVVTNIRRFLELRDAMAGEGPKIRIQTVRVEEMADEQGLKEYIAFWEPVADEICVIDYKDEKDADNERLIDHPYQWACPQLYQRMIVWWDGTILPCNEDDRGQLSLGNAHELTIAEAWNSEILQTLRQTHGAGNAHTVGACNGCYLRDSEIKKLMKVNS
tara:strand:+ start:3035 stop:4051 length:1017 start_codon:yes stop_codon:yes gene_type:complete